MTSAALKRAERPDVEADVLQERRDESQSEVAVDDGRYAGENLERRLQEGAGPAVRVLAQVDRGAEPERGAHERREEHDQERAPDERQHAELRFAEERRPLRAGEVVPDRDLAEELDRGQEERNDDPDGRCHRDEGAEGEDALDDVLAPAPSCRSKLRNGRRELTCRHLDREPSQPAYLPLIALLYCRLAFLSCAFVSGT